MSKVPRFHFNVQSARVDDGPYIGYIERAEHGRAFWGARKGRGGEKRQDWHCYYHVALIESPDARSHASLMAFQERERATPTVKISARYTTHPKGTAPFPIHSSDSMLYRLITLCRPGTSMIGTDIPFDVPVRHYVYVLVGHKERDWQQDPLPDDPRLRHSVVRKVLAADKTLEGIREKAKQLAQQLGARSSNRGAGSREQHSLGTMASFRVFDHSGYVETPAVSSTLSGRGIGKQPGGQSTGEAGTPPSHPASPDGDTPLHSLSEPVGSRNGAHA